MQVQLCEVANQRRPKSEDPKILNACSDISASVKATALAHNIIWIACTFDGLVNGTIAFC